MTTDECAVIGGLTPGTEYNFRIREDLHGVEAGEWLSIRIKTMGVAPTTAVGLALNLSLPTSTINSLQVQWENPDPVTCGCIEPTGWQVEYESAAGRAPGRLPDRHLG